MKIETFFEKFDQFADAPDAVAKMRGFVLDLAVQGRLSNQNTANENVESRYMDEPLSSNLPSNWRLLNFGKFCDIQGGNQPPKSQFSDQPRPGYVRLFQIRDLGERPVPVYIPEDSTKRFCREGEILIGRYGASVGKIFWARDGAYNVALAKFIYPEDALLPKFAFRVLKSHFFQAKIAGASRSAQAGFNKGDLASINFPLPPLTEQKRIVAKVDELMALCDRLEAQQQERDARASSLARASLARFADEPTPANLNSLFHSSYHIPPADLRKSILTLAIQGKLVPHDPKDEPVDELVSKLANLKAELLAQKRIRKQKVSDRPSIDNIPFEVPKSWSWIRLGHLASLLGGNAYKSSAYVPDSRNQIIRLGNVKNDELLLEQKPIFIPDKLAKDTADYSILEGDILITMTGTKNKRDYAFTVVVNSSDLSNRGLYLNQRVGAIRPFRQDLVPLINLFLKSDQLLDMIFATATGTANQGNIGTASILDLPFPLPPLAEQRQIVAKVDQLMALVHGLEKQLMESRAIAKDLLEALVVELTAGYQINKI